MKLQNYNFHIFASCFLFVMGGEIVSLYFYKMGVVPLLLAVVLAFLVTLFSAVLLKLWRKSNAAFYLATFTVIAAAIYGAADALGDLFRFLQSIVLPETSAVLLLAVLLFMVWFFARGSTSAILKYGLFAAVICTAIIVLCFVSGIKNFAFYNIKYSVGTGFKFKAFLKLLLPLVVLPFFASEKTDNAKPVLGGVLAGLLGVVICFFQSVLTLGIDSNINFPYLKSVSVISSGSLFTRLDGLVYFLFFASCLIKITVCINVIKEIITPFLSNARKML